MKETEIHRDELPLVRKTRVMKKKYETSESEDDVVDSNSSEGEDDKLNAFRQRTKALVKFASNFGLWQGEEEIEDWDDEEEEDI
jgi:hypothetical protein